MSEEIQYIYRCTKCDVQKEYVAGEPAPTCCDEPMVVEELPVCTSAPHPEMARNTDEDLPCEDSRGQEFKNK
jgi:hypothetical protein